MSLFRRVALAWAALAAAVLPLAGDATASDTRWDGSQPPPGIYFHWYEPSFYTGFAPRTQEASRIHLVLGRGSQQRVTVVLGEAELDAYLGDLDARHRLYQELIDAKVLTLSTNMEYEKFVEGLRTHEVAELVAGRSGMDAEAYRAKALEVLRALNPERVFDIRIPVATVAAAWHPVLLAADPASPTSRLDAANAVLPGRVHLSEVPDGLHTALVEAIETAKVEAAESEAFRLKAAGFVEAATSKHYRVRGDHVVAIEFTTIYPVGTADAMTTYKGQRIPDVGVTGIWPLIRRDNGRGQTGMVDYLSTNPGYGFIPLFAYQYAGGIAYNAFHNAGVRCQLNSTPFLPPEWRKVASERDGKPFQNLWIVGRGPTSHGCTRLPSGHMSELRQIVPSEDEDMVKVRNFRNPSQCYDVFDLRGDGKAAVMGVQYYIAYRSDGHTPVRAHAPNRREPFYQWLYGSNIEMGPIGQARLKEVPVCRFVGLKKAQEARVLRDVPLHEASFAPEPIQFYTIKGAAFDSVPGFNFNRELRKVGAGHTVNRRMLFLK